MNQLIHNTIWITGHFHLTVATTVVLTFLGAAFWLIPHLTGRILTPVLNKLGIYVGVLWTLGMGIMSGEMHIAGLLGAPRRSEYSTYGGAEKTPAILENFKVWGVILVALILFAYTMPHIDIISNSPIGSKGFSPW